MKKLLLALTLAALAALPGAIPAGAATAVGGGRPGGDTAPPPPRGTGPRSGEVALGSFVAPIRSTAGRHGAADDLKAGAGCSIQCITGGVAYGRGPDARLVVTTDTPVSITLVVSRAGYYRQIVSEAGTTSFSADVDDLEADTHYDAFVSAVDGAGFIANRSGSFTTLQRNAHVSFTEAHVTHTPYGDQPFSVQTWFEGERTDPWYGAELDDGVLPLGINIPQADDTDRYLEVAVELMQHEDTDDICETQPDPETPEAGQHPCEYVASVLFEGGSLDLDDRPGGADSWNHYEIVTELVRPNPYYSPLEFTVPITVEVTWT